MACTKILCAVDFSTPSHAALEEAASLAAFTEATLVLVHVYALPPPAALSADMLAWTPADADAEVLRALEPKMAELQVEAEAIAGKGRVETRLLVGDAASEIARLAGDGRYDLVVIGTHGRTGVKRLVLGSVAEHVVRSAPVSVLVIRAKPSQEADEG
jgi:nucleotide-binding universal stress UspA family protein